MWVMTPVHTHKHEFTLREVAVDHLSNELCLTGYFNV